MYQYLVKLQDLLSTPVMQMATKVNRAISGMESNAIKVTGGMSRNWQTVGKAFGGATNEAVRLRKEIASLNASRNFHMKVDSSEYTEAGKKIEELSAKLRALKAAGADDGGGGSFGGGGRSGGGGFWRRTAGIVAAMGGGLPGLLMSGGVYGAAAYGASNMAQQAVQTTVSPAMTRQMQEFQLGFQLGDQSAGKQLADKIEKLAVANPFLKSNDAFEITPALLTAGFKGTEIPEKLNMLTNLSVLAGRSIQDIAFQYKQIKMNGIAQQEELGQMADKLPVYAELLKITGAKDVLSLKKMITDGKITFNMVDTALGNIRGAKDVGQQASGMTQAKFNVLADQFEKRMIDIGTRALPMVNQALEYTSVFLDRIAPLGEPILKLAGAFSPLFESVGTLLKALGVLDEKNQLSAGFIRDLSSAIGGFADVVGYVAKSLKWMIDTLFADTPFMKFLKFGAKMVMPGSDLLNQVGAAHDQKQQERFVSPLARKAEGANMIARRANRNAAFGDDFNIESSSNGKGGGKSLGDAAGLSSTVEGARKSTTIINIGKLNDKIEVHVANMNEGIQFTESQLIEMLLRVVNSAGAVK